MSKCGEELTEYIFKVLKPVSLLSGSEWADRYFYLSPESSASPGKWNTRPWQKRILDVMTDQQAHIVVFKKPTRVGFALSLDTKIPTVNGWTTMGECSVGDDIFDENGKPCKVTYKSEIYTDHKCYTIIFGNGEQVVADAGHRWLVYGDKSCERVVSTEEVFSSREQLYIESPNGCVLITKVEEIDSVPVQCISVDSKSSLFLCTDSMIPTHNTKLLNVAHAYYIHQRPSVQLHYQPTGDEAKGYAEDEFEPMIRDNDHIEDLIQVPKHGGRTKREKTQKKLYPNGYIEFLGAESDRNFNRRTARVVSGDEIDTWKKEAGKAGDTITTMMRRTSDFWDRKNIIGGKPIGAAYNPEVETELMEGISIVDYWYKQGTQEHRYTPCPHCNHMQSFEFEELEWEKEYDEDGNVSRHLTDTAHFHCKSCDKEIFDEDKRVMDEKGEWRMGNPDAVKKKIYSFEIWAMLSYSPNVTWTNIADEFLEAKTNRTKLKAFYNEVLARTFEDEYVRKSTDGFMDRREEYMSQIPEGVHLLTCGADVQLDRIELEVIGWGELYESWSIEYKIFYGDPTQQEVWDRVQTFILTKTWMHEDGDAMQLYTGCIDAGYLTNTVAEFCEPLQYKRIFATKGANTVSAPMIPRKVGKTKERKPIYTLGTHLIKDEIAWHMDSKGKAGYMHFPVDDMYSLEYFRQLGAEARNKSGKWESKRKRNEVIDVRTYNFASLLLCGVDLELLVQRNEKLGVVRVEKPRPVKKQSVSYLDQY